MDPQTNTGDIHPDPIVPLTQADLGLSNTADIGSSKSPIASDWKSRNYVPGQKGWMLSSSGESDGIFGTRYILFKVMGPLTSHTVTTAVGGDLEIPCTCTITEIGAYVDTAGVTGTATIDVNKNGTTLMSATKITIDSSEKTSRTGASAPVLTTTSLSVGDIITVDIDAIQTTPAKGLTIRIGIN